MRAAVVHSFDQPLRVEDVPKPEAGPGQVVVKIESVGCATRTSTRLTEIGPSSQLLRSFPATKA